jgi:hypothetical protein
MEEKDEKIRLVGPYGDSIFSYSRMYGGRACQSASAGQKGGSPGQTRPKFRLDLRALEMGRKPLCLDSGPLGKETSGQSLGSRTLGQAGPPLGLEKRSLEIIHLKTNDGPLFL